MVASTGNTGKGVMFQIDVAGSPVTWVTVGNVRSINPTGKQADEIDFTHLLSDSAYREFRQGFKDAGSVNVDFHFDPTDASHIGTNGLLGLFNSGNLFSWRINFSGADPDWDLALTGTGFVSNPGDIDINVDGPIIASATVRVTGPTTLAAVA